MEKITKQELLNRIKVKDCYETVVNGRPVALDMNVIVNFLLEEFNDENALNQILKSNNLQKSEFFYCLKKFIDRYGIYTHYQWDKDIFDFGYGLVYDEFVDTMYLNPITDSNDIYADKFEINETLKSAVLNNMPEDYSDLQKAIYVYIKLCKLLTYDPEFYANNQRGMVALEHKELQRLEKVTPANSQIVCYEFTQIYAKFLKEFGITYQLSEKGRYGNVHSTLIFSFDKYFVFADSVTGILGGDLFNAKINKTLNGLKCINQNDETRTICQQKIQAVYDYVKLLDGNTNQEEKSFEYLLQMFSSITNNVIVTKQEKMAVLSAQCKNCSLPEMEKISYMLSLAKIIFREEQKNNKFDVSVVSKRQLQGFKIKNLPCIILSFNEKSFNASPNDTEYAVLLTSGDVEKISKNELKNSFGSGTYKHIVTGVKAKHIIPGIDDEEEVYYVK